MIAEHESAAANAACDVIGRLGVEYRAGALLAGRFRLKALAGCGSHADVFLADDESAGRACALKVLLPLTQTWVRRTLREAELLSRAAHANLLQVYDAGVLPDGHAYAALEWVDGLTLTRWRRDRGSLEVRPSVEIAIAIGNGVAALHALHALHRDVKPANVLIPANGTWCQARLIDLGLAGELDSQSVSGVTQMKPGRISGSPITMAPEQLLGRAQSAATDVFGLGAVLYWMIYGAVPHCDDTVTNFVLPVEDWSVPVPVLLDRLLNEVALPEAPQIPHALQSCLLRMLRIDPRQRPQSMTEAVEALERAIAHS
jgi:serine/threonine-protein kinase